MLLIAVMNMTILALVVSVPHPMKGADCDDNDGDDGGDDSCISCVCSPSDEGG